MYITIIRKGLEKLAEKELKGEILDSTIIQHEKRTNKPSFHQYQYELLGKGDPKKIDYSKIKEPFKVIARKTNTDISTQDLAQEIGEHIYEKYNKSASMTNPKETVIIEVINGKTYIGKTKENIKLSKKDYRIKVNPKSLPGDIANVILKISEYKKTETLLDPFCQTGEIVIEAKLEGGEKVFGTDSNEYSIQKTKFNSKVAGVKPQLKNIKLEDLGKEFKSVDKIVTSLPLPSRFIKKEKILKKYQELFYQATKILTDKGNLTIITTQPNLLSDVKHNLKQVKTLEIASGNQKYKTITFKK